MRNYIKRYLKTSRFLHNLLVSLVHGYLKFVYATTRWEVIYIGAKFDTKCLKGSILLFWHNRLTTIPFLFQNSGFHALVSPHSDGQIIAGILQKFGINTIAGSSNRDSLKAVKEMLLLLREGKPIGVTPDGPRGPKYKINGNVLAIAQRAEAKIITLSANITHKFILNSWDNFIIPLPFSRGVIIFSEEIDTKSSQLDNSYLESKLELVTNTADKYFG